MKTASRDAVVAFRVTPSESRAIDIAAQVARMDRGDYLRARVVGQAIATGPRSNGKGRCHGATLSSPRLSKIYEALRAAGDHGLTGLDLTKATSSLAISTCVSELRRCLPAGESVECVREGTTEAGAKVYRYRLVRS